MLCTVRLSGGCGTLNTSFIAGLEYLDELPAKLVCMPTTHHLPGVVITICAVSALPGIVVGIVNSSPSVITGMSSARHAPQYRVVVASELGSVVSVGMRVPSGFSGVASSFLVALVQFSVTSAAYTGATNRNRSNDIALIVFIHIFIVLLLHHSIC